MSGEQGPMSTRDTVVRPESVTVIAWLLMIFGAFELMGCLATWTLHDLPMMQPILSTYREPFSVVLGVACAGVTVHIFCAIALLMRQGWARHVYVVTALAMTAFSAWVSPWPQFALPQLLFPVVASMFLYRPIANQWFAEMGRSVAAD
jgi:hypothetical protein